MNIASCALLWCALLLPGISAGQTLQFDDEHFDKWINLRAGNGKKPAYWYCYGEVYAYPEGKLVARMQGVDVATWIPITKDSVLQLNRKIFLYLDKDKGTILDTVNGQAVAHIRYPYQLIEYVHTGSALTTYVTQGAGARLAKIGPSSHAQIKKIGNNLVFSFPAFMNFQTAKGKYEAYENFDFFLNQNANKIAQRHQLTWWRYGELPAFLGDGKSVIQLLSYRVNEFEDLPVQLKQYIESQAPMWKLPPADLAEIKALQAESKK